MLQGVLVLTRSHGFVQLPQAQSLERARLDAQRFPAELGHEDRRTRKNEVARQDRHRVAPHLMGRRCAAAIGSGVHDVVVIERGKVGQFNDDGGLHHLRAGRVAEVGSKDGQERTDPLAPRFDEVTARGIGERVGIRDRTEQLRFRAPCRTSP